MNNAGNKTPEQINLQFWALVETTTPSMTKEFKRPGGFKGTAIAPMYLIHKATSLWGPIGVRWGFREKESKIVEGVFFSKVELWYEKSLLIPGAEGVATIEQWGGTLILEKCDLGVFHDPDAAKKSVTDGLTKCLSYLGFAADVHMGRFDDNKYVEEAKRHEEESKQKAQASTPAPSAPAPSAQPQSKPDSMPVPPQDLPVLDGVTYRRFRKNGQTFVKAFGRTQGKQGFLKSAGFTWDNQNNVWFKPECQSDNRAVA